MNEKIEQFLRKHSGIFKDLSWTFIAQIIGNLLRFFLILFVVRCYTQEEFGLWASITSIAAVIVTGDFGLTNVLRNIASKGLTQGEKGDEDTKEAWTAAFLFMITFAIVGIIFLYYIKDFDIFFKLFKTENEDLKALGNGLVLIVIAIFLFNLPFGMSGGLFLSYGEVKEAAIFNILSSALTFIVVVLMSISHCRIDYVSIAYFVTSLFISFISTLYFIKKRKWESFHISLRDICRQLSKMLIAGIGFVGVCLSRSFIPSVLTIYSGAMLGLTMAANINVAQKIYTFFVGIVVGVINPIWSRLSCQYYKGEYEKCRKILKVNLFCIIVISLLIIIIATLARGILVRVIAGETYEADAFIFLLVGVCLCLSAICDGSSLLLMATNNLKFILLGYTIFSLMVLFIFPYIVKLWGFNCMMIIMALSWVMLIIVVLWHTRKLLRKSNPSN